IAALGPTEGGQRLDQRGPATARQVIALGPGIEPADPPCALALLRARGAPPENRRRCRAGEEREERAPLHSITSSARASTVAGTSRPSARAVLRLITSSNLVDCTTGRSAGLAPLSTRAV